MQFSKIAAVLSFAAAAVAAPAPVAAPAAALEARTTYPTNACKTNGKYSAKGSSCNGGEEFYCYQVNGILNILNVNCLLNGNDVNVPINVVVGDISADLLDIIIKSVKIL
ncbi:hypothetical protein EPUS_04581 [Endocarpon pusillum Z07020]|uniref:Hydrophobin n=1 Tax=Endocarpon pusillum (strain Z07020 / HMAS-L-300199) TaxID=1263415 RepID=U1GU89_ENDPU|nr:uncharacterized protein EPUS_04581 [Endocarpon pusillum Z07020]ERF75601.1 hypothetical protein EPUS_04581 [Endocarpon pusillum Z07020]